MATYSEDVSVRRGLVASVDPRQVSRYLDTTSPAGVVVGPGTVAQHCDVPASAAAVAKAVGVLVYDPFVVSPSSSSYDYTAADIATVIEEGEVWCVAEAGLAIGDQPYARFATGDGGTQKGALRADADTATAALLPNARVIAVTTGLAKISVNLPHGAAA